MVLETSTATDTKWHCRRCRTKTAETTFLGQVRNLIFPILGIASILALGHNLFDDAS
jgi:hypothetical protein